ncbi:MAG TPA: extracellular solute-binding protein [Chloroflexota bacterium]|jgi:multiple sugar transport system substrate-binding protein
MSNVLPSAGYRRLAGAALAATLTVSLVGGSLHAARAASTGNTSISGDVVFWNAYTTVTPENTELITKVLPAFEKAYPNVTVYSQNIPYSSLLQKLVASVAGGSGPDVVRSDIIWVPQLAKIGAITRTDDIVAQRKNQFYAGPLSTTYYKGHYYGLPLDTNTRVMIYSKALFAKAGISRPPATTDEFMADAAKITSLGKNVFGYAEGGLDAWNILPWLWSFGGAVTDPNFQHATGYLNSAKSVAGLQFLVDLKDKTYLSPSILGGGLATSDAIGKNQAGIIIDGPWMPPIFKAAYPSLQYGLAPMPAGPGGQSASVVGGEDIVQMAASKNTAADRAFMQFMTSSEAQVDMGTTGQMPVLKSVAKNPALPSYFAVFSKQLQTAYARTVSPNWVKIDTILTDAFNKAIRHQATAQAALNSAASQIDGLLK